MSWYQQDRQGQLQVLATLRGTGDEEVTSLPGADYRVKRVNSSQLRLHVANVTQGRMLYCACSKDTVRKSPRPMNKNHPVTSYRPALHLLCPDSPPKPAPSRPRSSRPATSLQVWPFLNTEQHSHLTSGSRGLGADLVSASCELWGRFNLPETLSFCGCEAQTVTLPSSGLLPGLNNSIQVKPPVHYRGTEAALNEHQLFTRQSACITQHTALQCLCQYPEGCWKATWRNSGGPKSGRMNTSMCGCLLTPPSPGIHKHPHFQVDLHSRYPPSPKLLNPVSSCLFKRKMLREGLS